MPTAAALEFVGAPDLGGAVRQAGLHRGVDRRPRGAARADRPVAPTWSSSRPATADLLAKAAHGLADDLLTNTLLTARCPVVFAPAMHTEMWEHPATQANVATLRERGCLVIEPAEGRLTGTDTGKGRLPDPAEIFERLPRGARPRPASAPSTWPAGTSWSPPAAPASTSTRCASSATAPRACRATRWPAPPPPAAPRSPWSPPTSRCPTPPASRWSASRPPPQLRDEVLAAAAAADAVVMAAAPADFRPAAASDTKIKKADDGSAPGHRADPEPRHPPRAQHPPRPRPAR